MKLYIMAAILCVSVFHGVAQAQESVTRESARLFLEEVWSKGNVDVANKILDPDFKFILAFTTVNGLKDFLALVQRNRTVFQDLTYKPTDIVADDDMAAAYWKMSARHIGTWRMVPASNKDVGIEGMSLFKFRNGKIVEIKVQNDVFGLLRQMGFVSAPEVVEKNKQIVRDYVNAILIKRDFTQFEKFTTPEFKIDRSAVPEAIAGAKGLGAQMDMLYKAFPDLDLKIVDMIASNDKVLVRFEAPGTHQNEFIGIKATGKKAVWKGLVLYEMKDGKINHAWADWDDYGLIEQLKK
jgi:steroid delta-isomerase-like uncharacterized protein